MRSLLYFIAQLLGDVNAVKRDRVKERIYNRLIGKITSKLFK